MTLIIHETVALGTVLEYTANAPSQFQYLLISNDSQYELTWYYDGNAGETRSLPPYTEVQNEIPIGAAETVRGGSGTWHGKIIFSTSLVPGTIEDPSPPARVLRVEGFAHPLAGERRTVRDVAQGSLIVGVAQQMQGAGQAIAVTELDSGASPALVPATGTNVPLVLSARDGAGARKDVANLDAVAGLTILVGELINALANAGIELGATNVANTPFIDFHTNGNFDYNARIIAHGGGAALGDGILSLTSAAVSLDGRVSSLAGQNTQGNVGVPVLAVVVHDQLVTTTGVITVVNIGVPLALFRIGVSFRVNNGISGNAITAQVSYTDSGGSAHTATLVMLGSAAFIQAANGANSFANSYWPAIPIQISTQAGSTLTVTYRDPTNTPNDLVSVTIERLN